MITVEQLQKCTNATYQNAERYSEALNAAMDWAEINTPQRVAAFLATVAVESGNLKAVEEGLFYRSADRLALIFPRVFKTAAEAQPCVGNPRELSRRLYNGFHGRGLIQLTWERNYKACGEALGEEFVSDPDLLLTPAWAAMSAAWFWKTNECNLPADAGDMDRVTRIVNGPAKLHLKERVEAYERALQILESNS